MSSMTDAKALVAKVRELSEKATKGPLEVDPTGDVGSWIVGNSRVFVADFSGEGVSEKEVEANAQLFATYRTAAPQLADMLETFAAENTDLRAALAECVSVIEEQMTDVRFSIASAQVDEDSEQSLIYCADQRAKAALTRATAILGAQP